MSDDIEKKQNEVTILKKVFGNTISFEESEQPDFILKYGSNIEHGVEITELYYDGTSARLKNGEYVKQLILEKKYWHKDDKKKLKVHNVTYYSKLRGYNPVENPILMLPKYSVFDYIKSLQHTIESKNKKLVNYRSDIKNSCMLIIYDKEKRYKDVREEDISKNLFAPNLIKAIRNSNFEEIYLVTDIDKKEKYIPLKAYLLQSDCLIFLNYIRENNLGEKLLKMYAHPFFGFAEVLKRIGCEKVLIGKVENEEVAGGIVIYSGRYGAGMVIDDKENWGVGIFDIYPYYQVNSNTEFVLEKETDFFDDDLFKDYEEKTSNIVASVGFNFLAK